MSNGKSGAISNGHVLRQNGLLIKIERLSYHRDQGNGMFRAAHDVGAGGLVFSISLPQTSSLCF